jgi:hypothetical protein
MIDFHSNIVIHTDSRYVEGIIHGAQTKKNEVMADILVHLWKRTRLAYNIRIVWVRGHSNSVGNQLADRIAAHGANEAINAERWSWRPKDWGYGEFRRDYPANYVNQLSDRSFHHNANKNDQPKTTFIRNPKRDIRMMEDDSDANENESAEVRRVGKGAPRILEMQNAIADAARACGKAKPNFKKGLPADHPAQIALKEAINQRSLEGNTMAWFYLHRWVYRCRRTVRDLTSTKEAEYVINNPRAPRRRKGGKQTIRGLGSGAVGEEVSFNPEHKSN